MEQEKDKLTFCSFPGNIYILCQKAKHISFQLAFSIQTHLNFSQVEGDWAILKGCTYKVIMKISPVIQFCVISLGNFWCCSCSNSVLSACHRQEHSEIVREEPWFIMCYKLLSALEYKFKYDSWYQSAMYFGVIPIAYENPLMVWRYILSTKQSLWLHWEFRHNF